MAYINVAISATFGANKMLTSNIDNANVIVIALYNIILKIVNANRMTIFHSNTVFTKLDAYMTAIKWQHSGQESKHQYSSKSNDQCQQESRHQPVDRAHNSRH